MPVRITPAVKFLMIACFAMFLVQHTLEFDFIGWNVTGWLGLVPSSVILQFRVWQLVTYSFLHHDVMHLFLNLMMLAFIGGEVEAAWGTRRFVRFYLVCTVVAGLSYLLLQMFMWSDGAMQIPMVGASGGIYGLLMAYGLMFGERTLLFMMLFPMKAKHFIWILAAVEFMSTVFSGRQGLAGIAHIGGMVAGVAFLWGRAAWVVWERRRGTAPARRGSKAERKRKAAEHLKLIINNDKDDRDDRGSPKTWH